MWRNWRCVVLKSIMAPSVSLVVFLGLEIRCDAEIITLLACSVVSIRYAVAMASVKEVELARGMANALATRYPSNSNSLSH